MPSLIIRKPWTSQPQQPVGIDWGNPITRGLKEVLGPNLNFTAHKASGGAGMPSILGLSAKSETTFGGVSMPDRTDLLLHAGAAQKTIFYLAYAKATSGTTAINFTSGGQNQGSWNLLFNSTTTFRYTNTAGSGSATGISFSAGLSSSFARKMIAIRINDTAIEAFVDGVLTGSATLSLYSGALATSLSMGLVSKVGDGIFSLFGAIFNRALSDAEIKSISDNPWRIFAPLAARFTPQDATVTIARPGSDITTAGWTGYTDNVTKYTNIDETAASDTDFITSPGINGGQVPITFGIRDQNGNANTLPIGTWDVNVRSKFSESPAGGQIKVTLLDSGGVSVGATAWQAVTNAYADYTLSITTTGIAARIRIEVQ